MTVTGHAGQNTYLPGAHLFEQLDRLMVRAEGLREWRQGTLTHGAERIEGHPYALIDWNAMHAVPRWYCGSSADRDRA